VDLKKQQVLIRNFQRGFYAKSLPVLVNAGTAGLGSGSVMALTHAPAWTFVACLPSKSFRESHLRLTGSMEAGTPRVLPSWPRSGDCSVADNPHRQQSVARESVFHDCAASPVLFRSHPRSGQKSECMKSFFLFFFRTLCYCTAQLSY
jgi:hypothetical protein